MAEEPQFHITVVTQQRRQRSDNAHSSRRGARGRSDAQKPVQADAPKDHQGEAPKDAQAQTGTAAAPATREAPAAADRSASSGSHGHHGSHGHSRSGSHRRHYKDYGTVSLGSMSGGPEDEVRDFTADPNGPTPTQGELQRQFYNKYNAILNRRYFTRNRNKVTRIILIALLVAVIFIVSIFGISAIRGNVAETLERPEVETVPVGTLDLG